MGACFSCETDGSERQVILLSLDDGSVVRARKSRLSLFADLANVRPDAIPTFAIDVKEKAGPLCVFGTKASPEGLKPLKPKDASAVDKALCKHDLFHGGEQGLFAAHATLDAKPCLLALTSLGRLFAVAGGAAFRTLHVTQLCEARRAPHPSSLLPALSAPSRSSARLNDEWMHGPSWMSRRGSTRRHPACCGSASPRASRRGRSPPRRGRPPSCSCRSGSRTLSQPAG